MLDILPAAFLAIFGVAAASSVAHAELRPAFQVCAACHTGQPDALGPDLRGVIGRRAGTQPGFHYSAAMQRSGLTWSRDTLRRYLLNPQGVVPGNRMPLGPQNPAIADAIVKYLETLK